jgi:hypothetical protein
MHASIHELLSIRDGEPIEAQLLQHVDGCGTCSMELARLQQVRERMRSLEMPQPPQAAWEQIRTSVQQPARMPARRAAFFAAAALAGVAVISGLLLRYSGSEPSPSPQVLLPEVPAHVPSPSSVSIEQLVAQSRELDELLSYLPDRPVVERIAMAATMDTIEQRVQWLDQQLSYAPAAGLGDAQTYRLWRERVDLMDSLVKVRYAEGVQLL